MNLLREHYQGDDAISYQMTDIFLEELKKWHAEHKVSFDKFGGVEDPSTIRRSGWGRFKFTNLDGEEQDVNGYDIGYQHNDNSRRRFSVLVEHGQRPGGRKKPPATVSHQIYPNEEAYIPVTANFYIGRLNDFKVEKGLYYSHYGAAFEYMQGLNRYRLVLNPLIDFRVLWFDELPDIYTIKNDVLQFLVRHEFTHLRQQNLDKAAEERIYAPRGQGATWTLADDLDSRDANKRIRGEWKRLHYNLIPSEIEANLEACMSIARREGVSLADVLFDHYHRFLGRSDDYVLRIIDEYRNYAEKHYPEYPKF